MTADSSPSVPGAPNGPPGPQLHGWQVDLDCYTGMDGNRYVNWYVYILMPDGVVYEKLLEQPCHFDGPHDWSHIG